MCSLIQPSFRRRRSTIDCRELKTWPLAGEDGQGDVGVCDQEGSYR